MAKGYDKRKGLFDKFSDQLLMLKAKGIININFKYSRPYLCPICLIEFCEDNLKDDSSMSFLTLEDAPPDSLGGSKIALTCKACNSKCGSNIDHHLTQMIREIDQSYFYKGSKHHGTIDFEGKRLNVELISEGNGTLTAYHRIKNNNPTFLDRFVFGIKNKTVGPILNIKPPPSKVDPKKVSYALLKTHYIITFSKFGYIFLLDKRYDSIREQLLNPDLDIFPYSPFVKNQFLANSIGTYYVLNKGLESILNIFRLKTEYSETIFGGLLPLPGISFKEFAERVEQKKDVNKTILMNTSHYDPNANLFKDTNEILKIANWINKVSY